MNSIHQLYLQTANPIGHFVRTGHTGHGVLENLYSAGRVSISHAVFDTNHINRREDLLHTLFGGGTEIILDTKCAELAYKAGLNSSINKVAVGRF